MDLPDYAAATAAAEHLTTDHRGQHRCTDGRYYTPSDWGDCPTSVAVTTLLTTLTDTRDLAHNACHDTEHVDLVLYGMTGLVAADLTDDDRQAWRTTVRMALETNAELLDPEAGRG